MEPIRNADRSTQLLIHATASSMAMNLSNEVIELDLSGIDEPFPAARKVAVEHRLAEVAAAIEHELRGKRSAVDPVPPATQGRLLAERDEVYDAVNRTYTPGPGFQALLSSVTLDLLEASRAQ